jgi:hypothetical protein
MVSDRRPNLFGVSNEGSALSHRDGHTAIEESGREDCLLGCRKTDGIIQVVTDLLESSVTY